MDGTQMTRCFDDTARILELVAKDDDARNDEERAFCNSFELPTAARVFGAKYVQGKTSVEEYLLRGKKPTSLQDRSIDSGAHDLLSDNLKKIYSTPRATGDGCCAVHALSLALAGSERFMAHITLLASAFIFERGWEGVHPQTRRFFLDRQGGAGLPSTVKLAAEMLLGSCSDLESIAMLGGMLDASILHLHPGGVKADGLKVVTSVDQVHKSGIDCVAAQARLDNVFFPAPTGSHKKTPLRIIKCAYKAQGGMLASEISPLSFNHYCPLVFKKGKARKMKKDDLVSKWSDMGKAGQLLSSTLTSIDGIFSESPSPGRGVKLEGKVTANGEPGDGVCVDMDDTFKAAYADGSSFAQGWDALREAITADAWRQGLTLRKESVKTGRKDSEKIRFICATKGCPFKVNASCRCEANNPKITSSVMLHNHALVKLNVEQDNKQPARDPSKVGGDFPEAGGRNSMKSTPDEKPDGVSVASMGLQKHDDVDGVMAAVSGPEQDANDKSTEKIHTVSLQTRNDEEQLSFKGTRATTVVEDPASYDAVDAKMIDKQSMVDGAVKGSAELVADEATVELLLADVAVAEADAETDTASTEECVESVTGVEHVSHEASGIDQAVVDNVDGIAAGPVIADVTVQEEGDFQSDVSSQGQAAPMDSVIVGGDFVVDEQREEAALRANVETKTECHTGEVGDNGSGGIAQDRASSDIESEVVVEEETEVSREVGIEQQVSADCKDRASNEQQGVNAGTGDQDDTQPADDREERDENFANKGEETGGSTPHAEPHDDGGGSSVAPEDDVHLTSGMESSADFLPIAPPVEEDISGQAEENSDGDRDVAEDEQGVDETANNNHDREPEMRIGWLGHIVRRLYRTAPFLVVVAIIVIAALSRASPCLGSVLLPGTKLCLGQCLESTTGSSTMTVTHDGDVLYKGAASRNVEISLEKSLHNDQPKRGFLCSMENLGRKIARVGEAEPSAQMVGGQLFFGYGRHCRVAVSPTAPSSFMARLGIGAHAKELREAYVSFDKHGRVQGVTPSGRVLWTMPRPVDDGIDSTDGSRWSSPAFLRNVQRKPDKGEASTGGEKDYGHRHGWLRRKGGSRGDEAHRAEKGRGVDDRRERHQHETGRGDALDGWI